MEESNETNSHRERFEAFCREKFEDASGSTTSKTISHEKEEKVIKVLKKDPIAETYSASFKFWVKKHGSS